MSDLELMEEDLYHTYMEEHEEEAEESASLQKIKDDEYIYHIMWPEYFLSNWHVLDGVEI